MPKNVTLHYLGRMMQTEVNAAVPPAPNLTPQELQATLVAWKDAKEKLAAIKDHEMMLRTMLVERSGFFDPNKETGTQNYELGQGWKIKAEKKLSYKVENKEGQAFDVMSKLCSMGEGTARVAKELFSFDANLRVGVYKNLMPEEKVLVDTILEIKPATPSLELVPPKGYKE